jgi:DNA-binding FadR family transcriptional regulator
MLDGIVARHHALSAASRSAQTSDPAAADRGFRAGMRSQEKLAALIEAGEGVEAQAHWLRHMDNAAKVWLANGAGEAIVTWSN